MSRSLTRQSMIVALVAALTDCSLLVLVTGLGDPPWSVLLAVAAIAAVDLGLALPPRTAGALAVAHVLVRLVAAMALPTATRITDVGYLVAGYRAGAWLSGAGSVATMLLLAAGVAAGRLIDTHFYTDPRFLIASTVSAGCVPWLVGRYTAARGAYIADLERRAQLRRQEHRVALEWAVSDERAAIARDLHDVISHHVSAIGIHAGVARMSIAAASSDRTATTNTRAAAAVRSLEAVESSSRAAMVDLRRQLDLLHGREDDGARQPGLADIEGLLDTVRGAGVRVAVHSEGTPVPLPDSVNITLYRVVQEMLTNALRHGDGTHARLVVRYARDRVTVCASNPFTPKPDSAATDAVHRGLSGIRRRVELFDGTVAYGAETDPGDASPWWRVRVEVPIGGT